MPRVEERILALLCHLANRWGHVTRDGVTLNLPITHEVLGLLIGARRPTVSLALRALTDQNLLRRRDDLWVLPRHSNSWPESGIPHRSFSQTRTDGHPDSPSAGHGDLAWPPAEDPEHPSTHAN